MTNSATQRRARITLWIGTAIIPLGQLFAVLDERGVASFGAVSKRCG